VNDLQLLSELERRALGLREADREAVYGIWGAFGDCWVIVDRLERHDCLQIYPSMNHFLDALQPRTGAAASEDPLLPFVETFRHACLQLEPEVAFLDTRAHYGDEAWENKQGSRNWVLDKYRMALESDVNALADERFPLLYLSESLSRRWESNPIRDDRDMVQTPKGLLVFARSGAARMD